jgi:hypothetical protein
VTTWDIDGTFVPPVTEAVPLVINVSESGKMCSSKKLYEKVDGL